MAGAKNLIQAALSGAMAAGEATLGSLCSPRFVRLASRPILGIVGGRHSMGPRLAAVRNVLVIRLDEIGDLVMTTPLLRELRRNSPQAWITLVVKAELVNLVELCPYVDEVLPFDWRGGGPVKRLGRAFSFGMMRLWRRRFDLALLPRWDVQYRDDTFLAYFSGAARRVGYSEKVNALKSQLNRGFDALLTHPLLDTSLKHEVERSLGLLHFLGGRVADEMLELWTSQADEGFASAVLAARHAAAGGSVVAFSPSAGRSPLKQWPVQRFAELGQAILQRTGARILLVGGPEDTELGEQIERALGGSVVNVVGRTSLRELMALLRRCAVLVSNDSGPMHVAVAAGIPVVALFGGSCPHRFGPWTETKVLIVHEQPCSPCYGSDHLDRCRKCVHPEPACMQAISVQEVLGHVLRLLARGTAPA